MQKEYRSMHQQFDLLIPQSVVITSNRAAQVWRRQKTKDTMRALTREAAADRYPVGRATIFVGIHKPTRGAYDPVNLADTFKGCVDELVTMGILDEDDYHHVAGPWIYHAGIDKRMPPKHIRATVHLLDYSTIPF